MSGATTAITTITAVIGAAAAANQAFNPPKPPKAMAAAPIAAAQAPEFKPVKPMAVVRPDSLGEYANFDKQQERSALATKGINQGLGKDESGYYKNLVQRSLIGDDNKPAPDTNSLLPVESQYFSRQGMNTSGVMDFLKQLQGTQ